MTSSQGKLMKSQVHSLLIGLLCAAWAARVQAQYSCTTNNGAITITEYTGSGGTVLIPDTINGHPVTSIGAGAFQSANNLTNVTIPEGVVDIGEAAFYGCQFLAAVTIPNSVTNIGDSAFSNCSGLARLAIDSSVINVAGNAFYLCGSLTDIIIGSDVTDIGYLFSGDYVLGNMTNIAVNADNAVYSSLNGCLFDRNHTVLIQFPTGRGGAYVIPDSVTNIDTYAFQYCQNLTSITIPDSVTGIGEGAFEYCYHLTNMTIPNGVTTIGDGAFYHCAQLTNVALGSGVTNLGAYLFGECAQLPGVAIPTSVTRIGPHAFSKCTGLTGMALPEHVTSIEEGTFEYCYNLTSVNFGGSLTNLGIGAFYECGLTSVVIPDSVVSIGQYAFGFCSAITDLTLGRGVTRVDEDAFWKCFALATVTVNSGVITEMGPEAFSYCSSLTSLTLNSSVTNVENIRPLISHGVLTDITVNLANPVYASFSGVLFDKAETTLIQFPAGRTGSYVIPNGVVNIGASAFGGYHLESLTIGSGVTNFPPAILSDCFGLTNITVNSANTAFSSINGVLFDKAQNLLIRFPIARGGSYVVPNGVTKIADSAFANCSGLTLMTIPNGVSSIGTNVFFYCSGLTNVVFGSGLADIGDYAFFECWNLAALTIPNSVTNIGDYAFSGCSGFTGATLGSGLVHLGNQAFSQCWSLMNIIVSTANPDYRSVNGVLFDKSQKNLILFPPARLGGYVIPATVTNIEDNAFYGCALTNLIIGAHVARIGAYAMAYSYGLTSITIPGGLMTMGPHAFDSCLNLNAVYFMGNGPSDDGTAFEGANTGKNFVYYLPGTTGWNSSFGGLPTVLWDPQAHNAGMTAGGFGFDITGPANAVIVVEACTNLASPVWLPVSTNVLSSDGASSLSDSRFRSL
jgi:BspA type Leucine rich repeat region (6 copies)